MDTVGRNKKQIQEYIKKQLEGDPLADQMSIKEYVDPFTGSKQTNAYPLRSGLKKQCSWQTFSGPL